MSHPPSPSQQRLISALRRLRESAGMSTYQLAESLGWNQSRVSRLENGIVRASAEDAEKWARATGADPGAAEELAAIAEEAWTETRSWRASHRKGLAARQREMGSTERRATEIFQFSPATVPGLLQSEGYARRALTFGDVTSRGGIDAATAERMKRQDVLREEGRRFEYILTEGALRWHPAPPEVMREQLGHLLDLAALPVVSLSVIPFSRTPAAVYLQPFTIYRITDGTTVLIENYHGESYLSEPGQLSVYERTFAALRASALTGDEALAFARFAILG